MESTHYRHLIKEAIQLAWPLAVLSFLNVLTIFVAVFVMAHFGHDALAASALISATQITLLVAVFSFYIALSAVVGRLYGAKEYSEIGAVLRQGWIISFLLSVPVLLLLYFVQPILLFFGQDPVLTSIVEQYFRAYMVAVVPLLLSMATGQFLVAVKKQIWVMWLNAVNLLVMGSMSVILGFGYWGRQSLEWLAWVMRYRCHIFLISFVR